MKLWFVVFTISPLALAADGLLKFVNYYHSILHSLNVPEESIHDYSAVLGGIVVLCLLTIIGFFYRKSAKAKINSGQYAPDKKTSFANLLEGALDFIYNVQVDIIGKDTAARFFPIVGGVFLFILVSNLTGLVPGFPPPTENISTNLAVAIVIFLAYNLFGFKEHGASYLKQFMGPVWWLAILMIPLELIAHIVRPISLSLRLFGNINGDHMVLSVFTEYAYVLGAFFLFFWSFRCCYSKFRIYSFEYYIYFASHFTRSLRRLFSAF